MSRETVRCTGRRLGPRAGITVLDAIGSLKTSFAVPLRARIGIASGLVVVVEQRGSGDTRHRVAFGETPNLATQLQAVAAAGEIVVAANTRRLVGRMFNFCPLAADDRSGLPRLVKAWQVRGETAQGR